ncbi:hypothetical protein [Bacillus sp. MUM 13]|uniref:hypothetical protein n=1 Tax=Bacillus sp. MUM 13 TaxID=1678001 RepID=UPI0008F56351|nr:hypothetical protein [Bacillus sp. MUM 13]OIK11697.1 hypothetical protein BIV59_11735 [Bacillus sp. MUM 13]
MLGMYDIIKFLVSFFLIFPIVTMIHLMGHLFFVTIFGGSKKRLIIGSGNLLFSFGKVEIRKYYFWNGACKFHQLKFDNRFTNTLIYLGGSIFNFAGMYTVSSLKYAHILDSSVIMDQFIYFSFYVLFFSLFPMYFNDGSPSDGKAAILALKKKHDDKYTGDILITQIEDLKKDDDSQER